MNKPIFLAAFGAAKHLNGDALILGQAHAYVAPDVADLPLQDLRGDFELFFGKPDGGSHLFGARSCLVFHVVFPFVINEFGRERHANAAGFSFSAEIVR